MTFNLVYNIDFEIIAFLFAVILYIETRVNFPIRAEANRIFRVMTIMVIITEAFDLISAFTITYAASIPVAWNVLINSCYFMSGLFLCYLFHYYIEVAVIGKEKPSALLRANRVLLVCIELAVILNAPLGFFFRFSPEGVYVRGALYLLLHLISLWFVLCASSAIFVNKKIIEKRKLVSSIIFVSVYFAAVVLQTFILPNVLIIMPAVSVMLLIVIFTLESPDYQDLQNTLRELTDMQGQLEEANQKYYNLAYTDLMTGLQNRSAYNLRLEELTTAPHKENVIFLMADINGLKELNDRLGHLVGDDAIERTAKLLEKNFADGCQCYRIGGDEFTVIGYDITEKAFEDNYHRFLEDEEAERKILPYPYSVAIGYQLTGSLTVLDAQKKADEIMYSNKLNAKERLERHEAPARKEPVF